MINKYVEWRWIFEQSYSVDILQISDEIIEKRTKFQHTMFCWRTHKTRLFIRMSRELIETKRPPERLFYSH